jgi:S1-C subfamily serine protease
MFGIWQKGAITFFLLIFIVGGFGGVFLDRFFIPILGEVWPFSLVFPSQPVESGVTVINKKEEITVRENVALEEAIEKTLKSVVKIEAISSRGTLLKEGTGVLVTNDGLTLVPFDIVKQGVPYVVINKGERHEAKVFKQDTERNIAILVLKEGRFPTASFGDEKKLRIGERIFLLGFEAKEAGSYPFVLEGFVRSLQGEVFDVSMYDFSAHGAPIFTIAGDLVGISFIEGKKFFVLPIGAIRSFLGF